MAAAPYCYGPTSKLLAVAEELRRSHTLVYVSSEPGLSLAEHGPFRRCIPNVDRHRWSADAISALRGANLLISFLDYNALAWARRFDVPAVFFDTLYWSRAAIPAEADYATLYVAQRFFDPPGWQTAPRRGPWKWVGPVLSPSVENTSTVITNRNGPKSIIVNLGGLRSPAMLTDADLLYQHWVWDILRNVPPDAYRITLCLPIYLRSRTKLNDLNPGTEVCFPSLNDFHDRLVHSDLLLTVPGLEVVFEAMAIQIPIIFLPPYNGSQALQLAVYQHHGIGLGTLSTGRRIPIQIGPAELSPLTRQVQEHNAKVAADRSVTELLARQLRDLLSHAAEDPSWCIARIRANGEQFRTLGSHGRVATARAVESMFNSTQSTK